MFDALTQELLELKVTERGIKPGPNGLPAIPLCCSLVLSLCCSCSCSHNLTS
jgi:hypothetical protein